MDLFSTYTQDEQVFLQSAYDVITRLEKWNVIQSNPPGQGGYLFTNNTEIETIMNAIADEYQFHSGTSLAWTMRIMQQIASLSDQTSSPDQNS